MARPALEISKLTPAERLQLVEELWESLCDTPEAVPLTEAQQAELDRRLDDLEHEGPTGVPWDEVVRACMLGGTQGSGDGAGDG